MSLKVAVMGGGSSYTPELVKGFLDRVEQFPITELWLMDILPERLEIVGKFAQRMVKAAGAPFEVHLTTDQRAAITNANYVTTQLRVGWMQARREDEYLGKRHGLIGQETTGIGGMAKALRTIPVILSIARDMQDLAPGAMLVNFTNPAGLVTQALSQYAPQVPSVGVCNVPITTKMGILEELGLGAIDPSRAELDTLGLNHLTWHRGFKLDGEELWSRIMERAIAHARQDADSEWDADTLERLQMIPNYYLQYFYYTDKMLAQQAKWPPSRAEKVMEIEEGLFRQYAEPDRSVPPEGLMQRGGAYYSTVATQLLNAHYNDLNEVHVVNVVHNGAVEGYPEEWVMELPCLVNRSGIEPIPTPSLPIECYAFVSQIKAYELLTVEAAVHGDREAAYKALLTHPLGPSPDKIDAVLDDLLETNRPYLPQFFA
jgi:6-phospho-beta-glucosidase